MESHPFRKFAMSLLDKTIIDIESIENGKSTVTNRSFKAHCGSNPNWERIRQYISYLQTKLRTGFLMP